LNYSIKGMLNMPLSDDKLALRVVALQRFDAGFLDNINTGKKGTNDLTTTGARMSMVWQPSEGTKVSLLALLPEDGTRRPVVPAHRRYLRSHQLHPGDP
jgi:hypothetical protein